MGAVSLLPNMNEDPRVGKVWSKMFDAHISWLCCLIALGVALASFRHDALVVELIPVPFSFAGVVFGVRALVRGPLRVLGGVFLIANVLLFVSSIGILLYPDH